MKKPANFFKLLIEQSEFLELCMRRLYDYCSTGNETLADEIIKLEDDADMVRRILIDELNRTFITPIDREDLFNLSRQLDEIIDYAKTTIDEIRLFKIAPNEDMTTMTKSLWQMSTHIKKAVASIEKYKNIAKDEAFKVKSIENKVGSKSCHALARLFENEDFRTIFKYREVYRHLNHTSDIADHAMDYLLDILVKM